MKREYLLSEALRQPSSSIEYYVGQQLADAFPDKFCIHGGESLFSVEEYALAGLCTLKTEATVYSDMVTIWQGQSRAATDPNAHSLRMSGIVPVTTWSEKGLMERARNAWFEVNWRKHDLHVIVMNWGDMFSKTYCYWILADSKAVAEDFLVAVCAYNAEIRSEILVFDNGCWRKDSDLFQEIQSATFDGLVLRGTLKQDILSDLEQFFVSRDLYERFRVPWKRGILFVGPPGNGKTYAVKGLINTLRQPCLYVRSVKTDFGTDDENIRRVFARARKAAPCVLVLEDLDALITPQNRAFILNELDGFAANVGIVTLATTNHPERLDPAILERPSRFDRKYPFELPNLAERQTYLALWNDGLEENLRLSVEGVEQICQQTEGFSFAYLKELFLSSMMRWITNPQSRSMDAVMAEQVTVLREQMNSATQASPEEAGDAAPQSTWARVMAAARRANS